MTTRIQDRDAARADPGGFAWTLLLTLALVTVIGLIAYLVIKGDSIPAQVERVPAPVAAPPAPSSPVEVR